MGTSILSGFVLCSFVWAFGPKTIFQLRIHIWRACNEQSRQVIKILSNHGTTAECRCLMATSKTINSGHDNYIRLIKPNSRPIPESVKQNISSKYVCYIILTFVSFSFGKILNKNENSFCTSAFCSI